MKYYTLLLLLFVSCIDPREQRKEIILHNGEEKCCFVLVANLRGITELYCLGGTVIINATNIQRTGKQCKFPDSLEHK